MPFVVFHYPHTGYLETIYATENDADEINKQRLGVYTCLGICRVVPKQVYASYSNSLLLFSFVWLFSVVFIASG